jgi:hypothetical protein
MSSGRRIVDTVNDFIQNIHVSFRFLERHVTIYSTFQSSHHSKNNNKNCAITCNISKKIRPYLSAIQALTLFLAP